MSFCERIHTIESRVHPLPRASIVILAVCVLWSFEWRSARGQSPSADDIARRVQDRDTGRDARSTFRMKLVDRRGRVRERAMTLISLRGRGNPGVPDTAPDGDRLLIRFTHPSDIRGTSFLVWEHPSSEDERFLYLPSLGRVRRIAGAETQESFVGSDFTYEDIGGRELDEYTYALIDQQASWSGQACLAAGVAPEGRLRRVPARRLARAQRHVRRRPGGHLQQAEREAEGLHHPPARADRGHLDHDGRGDDRTPSRSRAPSS